MDPIWGLTSLKAPEGEAAERSGAWAELGGEVTGEVRSGDGGAWDEEEKEEAVVFAT